MLLQLVGSPTEITEAIDRFPANYHADFAMVRPFSRRYATEQGRTRYTVVELAKHLRTVLVRWGAGTRKAPQVRGEEEFTDALLEANLHSDLKRLAGIPLTSLSVEGRHRLLNGDDTSKTLEDFDVLLLSALNNLSDKFFLGNTNVTYPMKAALLIAGLMPAFDSNVRKGMSDVGFEGMSSTQFLLPRDTRSREGKKITRLPFLLGLCWSHYQAQLVQGIQQSKHQTLLEDPGRFFDVLFFVQGEKNQARENQPILRLFPDGERWYELF